MRRWLKEIKMSNKNIKRIINTIVSAPIWMSILFVALKVFEIISWRWGFVLLPLIIGTTLGFTIIMIIMILLIKAELRS
jgi:hypothetical protein